MNNKKRFGNVKKIDIIKNILNYFEYTQVFFIQHSNSQCHFIEKHIDAICKHKQGCTYL